MKKWLKILLIADFFIILGMGMIAPIYAIFVEQIGGGILDASGAWAAFAFTSGVLMYLIGKWEDKDKHYDRILFLGYLFRTLGFLGYFFVQNIIHLFGVQILLGVSLAMTEPSWDVLYSKYLERGKFGKDWGLQEGMTEISMAIAALIGGGIAAYFGFKVLFIIMFISGVVGTIFSISLMSRKARKAAKLI